MKAGMPSQPLFDLGMFVGGVVVGDDMDVEISRALAINQLEKGQPFLMAVARRQAGDELAFEIIERGKQGQRAVPHVIMGLGANVPDPQGQTGCVRSSAWHCDFSSQHITSALSGGSR